MKICWKSLLSSEGKNNNDIGQRIGLQRVCINCPDPFGSLL